MMKTRAKNKAEQPKQKRDGMQFREAAFEVRADETGKQSVRMTVSSETPVLSYIEFNGEYMRAYEILDHAETSIDMSRCRDGLVILDQHYGDQVGLMSVGLEGRKMGGEVEFCSGARAQEIMQDAVRKLRRNTSVGYRVDASSYRLEGDKDGIPVVRAMSWMPYEASFVPVPADASVGVGRAVNEANNTPGKPAETRSNKMEPKEMAAMFTRAAKYGIEAAKVQELLDAGKGRAELDAMIVEAQETQLAETRSQLTVIKTQKPDRPAGARSVDDPAAQILAPQEQREVQKRFSIVNVIRHMAASAIGETSGVDIGFEREVSAEMAKRTGKPARGIYIPHGVSIRANEFLKTGNGSNFVATNLLSGSLIDALRSKLVLSDAGVTILSGLTGDIAIPKGGTIAGGWVDGENGTVANTKPTLGQVTGTPKTVAGECIASRRLYLQSSIDIESFIQNELLNTLARLIETAAFAGTAANGQPRGLATSMPGVNNPTVTANAPTRAQMLGFIEAIMTDNAEYPGQSWIMRPTGMTMLANRLESVAIRNEAGAENVGGGPVPGYLLDINTKTMLGYPVHVTTNVPNHSLFFGAWSQMILGFWSGVDLTVDPYSNSSSGAVKIVAHQDVDVMVRNGESFSYNAALTA